MQDHSLFESGVLSGVEIDGILRNVLNVENVLGRLSLLLVVLPRQSGWGGAGKNQNCDEKTPRTLFHLAPVPAWMTRIAVRTGVNVPADVRMVEVGRVVVPVATRALEYRVVVGVGVAGCANAAGAAMARRERHRMRERNSRPSCGVVAGRAGARREPRDRDQSHRDVVRHRAAQRRRAVPIRRVAAVAIGRRRSGR